MVIGETSSSVLAAPDFKGGLTLYPIDEPSPVATEGTMYYNKNDHGFKYSDGTNWQDFGGGFWAKESGTDDNIYNTNSGTVKLGEYYLIPIGNSAGLFKTGISASSYCRAPPGDPYILAYSYSKIEDGKLWTKANIKWCNSMTCPISEADSGWIEGISATTTSIANCPCVGWACTAHATSTASGSIVEVTRYSPGGGTVSECTDNSGHW